MFQNYPTLQSWRKFVATATTTLTLMSCTSDAPPTVIYTLMEPSPEPKGANCEYGGLKIEQGLDSNSSGSLDTTEIKKTTYLCAVRADGKTSMVISTPLAAGDKTCKWGGSKIITGLDQNDNKNLEESEIQSTGYSCKGEPGTNGTNGSNGTNGTNGKDGANGINSLVKFSKVNAQESQTLSNGNCMVGGVLFQTGLDTNQNGKLDTGEINTAESQFFCAAQIPTVVKIEPENPGTNCEQGGVKMMSGIDENKNYKLDAPDEVDSIGYVCNKIVTVPGKSVAFNTKPATAQQCPSGGYVTMLGLDKNYDGVLQVEEVSATIPVCNGMNGTNGKDGKNGVDGLNSLILPSSYMGSYCGSKGGVKYDVGLDLNDNNTLDSKEIQYTTYICTGEDGKNGKDGFVGYDGWNSLIKTSDGKDGCGIYGGTKLQVGLDKNANGYLDSSEIQATSYICNGLDGFSPLVEIQPDVNGTGCGKFGGSKIVIGIDLDGNGKLGSTEVTQSKYVCNGLDGYSTAIYTYAASKSECPYGGFIIETGLDLNGNKFLDANEVDDTQKICNP